ncbi:FecCD family ABC transporter permease [Gordonia insulae]|uniref:Ferric enterobactin transport system permease protein FepG n=1 Tax=Gordonia insulae TaxID=2420509 RepID=A0A3G8JHL4_9ACTN|nr:iron chelate uptake ABC transporter family permease subunit [Gordonia insulae]AZG44494.1 Ferric enterobactin transport system permease protein FepG [Gordonia insulae]
MTSLRTEPVAAARWPRRIRFIRGRFLSIKVDLAAVIISVILVVIALAVGTWSLGVSTTDTPRIGFGETLRVLAGQVSGEPANLVAAALPAVVIALIGGASLALSGAVFQTITRNPLGSPDIIGLTTGANTGALIVMLVMHDGSGAATIGALLGSLVTAAAVYFLGMRGGTDSYRFVVVGVGINAMLLAFNGYLISNANLQNAASAAAWGMGNLHDIRMSDTVPVFVTLVVLVPFLIAMAPRMRMFELGTDSAQSKGVDTGRTQLILLILGVGFAAVITAVAGPISFIALVAPQLAARISPSPGIPLVTSAAVGAALLVSCDAIARTILAPETQLPVGVVTTSVGGVYLLGLLLVQSRKAR